MPAKLLPPLFEQIPEGRIPPGVLPKIREGLLCCITWAVVLIIILTGTCSALPVPMMAVTVGVAGRPGRRIAGALLHKGLRPKLLLPRPPSAAPVGGRPLLPRQQRLVRLVDSGEVVVGGPSLFGRAGIGQHGVGMVPPGHAAVGRLEGRWVGGGGGHHAAGVEAEEDERIGGVGEGGGGVRGRVRIVGVPEGGGTAAGDGTDGGDGTIGGRATFAIRILMAAENNGRRLEAPRRPEVGQQQEGGDGEGPLHRLGWGVWLLPTSPSATPGVF
mmetsp:Transcript_7503/g.17872  ORF Transcript_7503/g.17872 Transcript_7503/m.17872 type:complete len:272 (-) Transcript_7503:34-849(-)